MNCNADVNDKEGAEAKDWRKGKPVRVLRKGSGDEKSLAKGSNKGKSKTSSHNSSYAPEIGVRYSISFPVSLVNDLMLIYLLNSSINDSTYF